MITIVAPTYAPYYITIKDGSVYVYAGDPESLSEQLIPSGPGTPSFLLMETGDYLLLESGDKILLE